MEKKEVKKGKVSKHEMAAMISEITGEPMTKIKPIMDGMAKVIIACMEQGFSYTMPQLGTFYVKEVAAGEKTTYNFQLKEKQTDYVEEHNLPGFRFMPEFKARLKEETMGDTL